MKWGVVLLSFLYAGMLCAVETEPTLFIAKLKSGALAAQSSSQLPQGINKVTPINFSKAGQIQAASEGSGYLVYESSPSANLEIVLKILQAQTNLEYVEKVYPIQVHSASNSNQMVSTLAVVQPLSALAENESVLVAVIDSGIDYTHPDLSQSVYQNLNENINGKDDDGNRFVDDKWGYQFYRYNPNSISPNPIDSFGHGTHLAGIIGAQSSNNTGMNGINGHVKLLNTSFLNGFGYGNQVDAAKAIIYSVDNGARVINCSWGYSDYNTVLKEAIDYALSKGVIVVASSGNNGSTATQYPASFQGVLSVGSNKSASEKSDFSNYGPQLFILLPGENVPSCLPKNGYGTKTGTSQSAAMLTGIISKMLSYKPNLTPQEVKSLLQKSTQDIYSPGRDDFSGYGVLDPSKLVYYLKSASNENTLRTTATEVGKPLNFPNPFGSQGTRFGVQSDDFGTLTVRIFNRFGALVQTLQQAVNPGYNTLFWNGSSDSQKELSNGTYFYVTELSTSSKTIVQKNRLTILR